ncbi:MAG TPA: O-antigen ligase family protein [Candidatus Eremiobacteraeota bacterium]|nr:MAG: O-Antigen ligase [bacterium ADurb.Bin363]HPZ08892.1 O-antigen ligase family protein [Candidatus Eremiobacteraeota bacterium]
MPVLPTSYLFYIVSAIICIFFVYFSIKDITLGLSIFLFSLVFPVSLNAGFTKIDPYEIMLLILILIYVIKEKKLTLFTTAVELPFICLIIISFISMLSSQNLFASIKQILKLIEYFLVFIISLNIMMGKPDRGRTIYFTMIYICLMVCIYGFIIDSIYTDRDTAKSIFVHYNIYGSYINLYLPFTISLLFFKKKLQKKELLMWIFINIILITALVLSLSRGSWVSLLSVILFYLFLKRRDKKKFYLTIIILLISGIISVILMPDFILSRVNSIFKYSTDTAILHRFDLWKSSFKMFLHHPLIGIGTGNFDYVYPDYAIVGPAYKLVANHANNMYINILTETGLSGFIIFMWYITVLWKEVINSYKKKYSDEFLYLFSVGFSGILLALCIHGFFDYMLYHPRMALNFMVILAIFFVFKEDVRRKE